MRFWAFCASILCCTIFLVGCSTSTLFESYPDKMAPNLQAVESGNYQPAIQNLTNDQNSADHELYAAELGRIEQLSGDYQASSKIFLPLMVQVENDQLAAKIQISHVLADSGSLLTNDNVIPYDLSGFQIVMLYQFQALNFIGSGDLDDALVALRKANIMQTTLAEDYQQELAAVNTQIKDNQLDPGFLLKPQDQLASTLAASAGVKSSFLNAMSYYLFALLSEAAGNNNDAAAALKQAVSIMPQNTYLQTALLQALQAQGADSSTIDNYLKAFDLTKVPVVPPKNGTLVVWYDQSLVPPLAGVTIPIYLPVLNQTQIFSFPIYNDLSFAPVPLEVSVSAENKTTNLPETQVITNVYALAAKQLQENYPMIFLRAGLRIIAKAGLVNQFSQNQDSSGDQWAALVAQVYSLATSEADLRSWLTLPNNTQIGAYSLPAQTYQLTLAHFDPKTNLRVPLSAVNVPITANQTTLVWVSEYGAEQHVEVFSLH